MLNALILLAAFFAPVLDELTALKQLPDSPPTYSWSMPKNANRDEFKQTVRITGSAGADVKGDVAAIAEVIKLAGEANAMRLPGTRTVVFNPVFRPWLIKDIPPIDPTSDAAWKEFGLLQTQLRNVAAALKQSAWKPRIVPLVDAEGLLCTDEAKKAACQNLYATYDLIIRAYLQPEAVEWYGMAAVPAPQLPDEWGFHYFSAPFEGMLSLGFEWYYTEEAIGRRLSSHKARAMATSLGISKTTVWITTPGGGRRFLFAPEYSTWVTDVGPDTSYSAQLAREIYGKWYRGKPSRFMDPVDAVACYPHWLTPTITDPDRKHLIAFLKAGAE